MKEIIFGESLRLDKVNKNGRRIYSPEQIFLDTSDIKYNIMNSKSIVYRKIAPDDCSYSGRGSFYPILSNTDIIYLFRKWYINDLVKEGKVKDAIKLLLEGRFTKYPRLEVR